MRRPFLLAAPLLVAAFAVVAAAAPARLAEPVTRSGAVAEGPATASVPPAAAPRAPAAAASSVPRATAAAPAAPAAAPPAPTTPATTAPAPSRASTAAAAAATSAPANVTAIRKVSTAAGPYALSVNSDGSSVRWNPCRTVVWRANLASAPPGALADLTVAFATLSNATGIPFTYGGTTDVIPTQSWLHDSNDTGVVVAWAPKTATDLFGAGADGEGGWYERGVATGATRTWQIVRGFVLLDSATSRRYAAGFGAGVTRGALLLHEVAHAVGLSHVDDRHQLLYPTIGFGPAARYGAGDLLGLAAVGRTAGCIG